jgi:hypothetical protein
LSTNRLSYFGEGSLSILFAAAMAEVRAAFRSEYTCPATF